MPEIIYEDFLNPPIDDNTPHVGMSHSRPVKALDTETVPDVLVDQLGGSTNVRSIAGGASVRPNMNAMMVNTTFDTPDGSVKAMGTDYDTQPDQVYEDEVVGDVMDSSDLVTLESLVVDFEAALEAMQYTAPAEDTLDPNQPVDLALLMNEVEYADDGVYRANERVEYLTEMRDELIAIGGVSKDQVMALESRFPQAVTAMIAIETFTIYPTRTNYRQTIASIESVLAAASAAGLTLLIYGIAKLIKWCINKLDKLRYEAKSDSVRGEYLQRLSKLNKAITRVQNKFANVYSKDEVYMDYLVRELDKVIPHGTIDEAENIVVINTMYQNALFQSLVEKIYNGLHKGMYSTDTTNYCKQTAAVCSNLLVSINSQYTRIKDLGPTDIFDVNQLTVDMNNLSGLATTFGVSETTDLVAFATEIQSAVGKLLEPLNETAPAFTEFTDRIPFKLDGTFDIDDRAVRGLRNIGSVLKRWEGDLKDIEQPEVRANRAEIYKQLSDNVKGTAALIASVTSMHDSVLQYIAYLNQTISRTQRMWQEAFKKANVNFGG